MKIFKSIMTVLLLISALYSCKHKKRMAEAGDKEVSVQVTQLDDTGGSDAGLSYKARLIPDKQFLQGKSKEQKDGLLFKMDSCFYLVNNGHKTYASMVQPVANGIQDTYEYLLLFDEKPDAGGSTMIYHDKYISKKDYTLKLDKE